MGVGSFSVALGERVAVSVVEARVSVMVVVGRRVRKGSSVMRVVASMSDVEMGLVVRVDVASKALSEEIEGRSMVGIAEGSGMLSEDGERMMWSMESTTTVRRTGIGALCATMARETAT